MTVKLQVLICTYGADGIARLAQSRHPKVSGVEYLVSWQTDGSTTVPESLVRYDMKIYPVSGKGLSANRNHALVRATAPLLLISDDDVVYTEENLLNVISAFDDNADADILTFRYDTLNCHKTYPERQVSLACPPKGYFISSIEIAFRRDSIQGRIWFNENFGIGAIFPSGEEDVFIHDCLSAGLTGRFIPATVARHDGDTTTQRTAMLPSIPLTKGAVFIHTHPADWLPRMAIHALRESRGWFRGRALSPFSYVRNWLRGVRLARRLRVFPTPDYSAKYLRHG
ncbi:MAG: glycosyltransferase family 2 protein [Muribaculaceae bacterium]|nr:glycosyltransferase family 2 protein [Muribaculaceae bacterium]